MKNLIKFLLIVVLTNTISAQNRLTKKQLDSLPKTLENEFVRIYNKSNNWDVYKMIKRSEFQVFQKTVLDSVSLIKQEITKKQELVNQQKTTIDSLNVKVADLDKNLNSSLKNQNSLSLFGLLISKTLYNLILWLTIIALLSGLLFFIFQFKRSNILTKKAKESLNELEQEFEEHRKRSIEREQKLRRKLQDEINKQRGV